MCYDATSKLSFQIWKLHTKPDLQKGGDSVDHAYHRHGFSEGSISTYPGEGSNCIAQQVSDVKRGVPGWWRRTIFHNQDIKGHFMLEEDGTETVIRPIDKMAVPHVIADMEAEG